MFDRVQGAVLLDPSWFAQWQAIAAASPMPIG
jgi:hypothetical protein